MARITASPSGGGGDTADYTPQALGAEANISLASSGHYTKTIDAATTMTLSDITAGNGFVLRVLNDGMMGSLSFTGHTITSGTWDYADGVTNTVTGHCFDGSTVLLSVS